MLSAATCRGGGFCVTVHVTEKPGSIYNITLISLSILISLSTVFKVKIHLYYIE